MLPPPEFLQSEDGGLPSWSLAVLLLLALSLVFLRPFPATETTLEDGLGPKVIVERL